MSNTQSYDPEHTDPFAQDYDGRNNTERIIDFYIDSDESPLAAEYASNLDINGYDDWYLPTLQEISIIEQVIDVDTIGVWSCMEAGADQVWAHQWKTGHSHSNTSKHDTYHEIITIPIRRF